MKKLFVKRTIRILAIIYGTLALAIPLIALSQVIGGIREFNTDWRNYVLYSGLIVGLSLAYKWPLLGGSLALIGVLVSGFIHPIVLRPGVLWIVYWFIFKKLRQLD